MKVFCDIDNTICKTEGNNYLGSIPLPEKIAKINQLFDQGNEITYWTSRGNDSGKDWLQFTQYQLDSWGCKYHNLKMGKPSYDLFYEDKSAIL